MAVGGAFSAQGGRRGEHDHHQLEPGSAACYELEMSIVRIQDFQEVGTFKTVENPGNIEEF